MLAGAGFELVGTTWRSTRAVSALISWSVGLGSAPMRPFSCLEMSSPAGFGPVPRPLAASHTRVPPRGLIATSVV